MPTKKILLLILSIIIFSTIIELHEFTMSEGEISLELLWLRSFKFNGDPADWPVLVDINDDSKLEIIAQGDFRSTYIFDSNGHILANFSEILRWGSNPYSFVMDYDNDGVLEYFIAVDYKIDIIDLQDMRIEDEIQYYKMPITGVLYGDWDSDGSPELLIDYWGKGLYLYDFKDKTFRFLMNESIVNGKKVYVWGYLRPLGGTKIVFFNFATKYCALGVVDLSSRKVLWAVNVSEVGMSSTTFDTFLVGDFDNDGIKEIVIPGWYPELYVFSSDDGHLEAYFNFTSYVIREAGDSYFAVADLDGDGVLEGIFAFAPYFFWLSKNVGFLAIIDMQDYSIEHIITYPAEEYRVVGIAPFSVNIFDVDLDGVYDIFVMNGANFTIYDGAMLKPKFTYNISTFFKDYYREGFIEIWGLGDNDIVVGDINNDGYLEIINRCVGWTISVFRLIVEPFLVPLVYWVPPYGFLNTFGLYENFDHDHDRVADWIEVKLGFNPNSKDSDNDGISDFDEILSIYRNAKPSGSFSQVILIVPLVIVFVAIVYIIKRRKINIGSVSC